MDLNSFEWSMVPGDYEMRAGRIRFGIYACSPEDSSFTAEFSDLELTECRWLAHDGQQPD